MKRHLTRALVLCLLLTSLVLIPSAQSQNQPSPLTTPSKYIAIENAAVRPGQQGALSQIEAQEVRAERAANYPLHYVAAVPITGGANLLHLQGFNSFGEFQKAHRAAMTMHSVIKALLAKDAGEKSMVSGITSSIYEYRKSLSLHPDFDLSQMRLLDIRTFHIRLGHFRDFESLTHIYQKASQNSPTSRWYTLVKIYGRDSGSTVIMITPLKSLADVDEELANRRQVESALNKAEPEMMDKLESDAIRSQGDELYAINPTISYAPEAWAKTSPGFWNR